VGRGLRDGSTRQLHPDSEDLERTVGGNAMRSDIPVLLGCSNGHPLTVARTVSPGLTRADPRIVPVLLAPSEAVTARKLRPMPWRRLHSPRVEPILVASATRLDT
jgi:hypothetical protein